MTTYSVTVMFQAPGELGNFGQKWNPYPDNPVAFSKLQLKELKNGRLAMLAIMGEILRLPRCQCKDCTTFLDGSVQPPDPWLGLKIFDKFPPTPRSHHTYFAVIRGSWNIIAMVRNVRICHAQY